MKYALISLKKHTIKKLNRQATDLKKRSIKHSEKDLLLPKYATKSSHSVEGAGAELCGEIQHM